MEIFGSENIRISTHCFKLENQKNNTKIVRKLFNYGAELDPDVKYLKTELITSRFRVSDQIQLDIHIGIASYLSKIPLVYQHRLYIQQKVDSDSFLLIKDNELESENYTIYFMFLLDYKNISNNEKDNNKTRDK